MASWCVLRKEGVEKWCIWVDFTVLNVACPKDRHPLSNIDFLIDGSSGYKTLSFMDAYSRYNQNKMDPIYSLNTVFMSNHSNYYYNITLFGLMDMVFSNQIGHNLEVYIDDMIVKKSYGGSCATNLKNIL